MQLNLVLTRKHFNPESTLGELKVNGVFQCYTLEDVVRPPGAVKVYGKTAIPAGQYKVTITQSNRFKRLLPLVNDVPNFEGIRIHPGNTDKDTDGCILVGKTIVSADFIGGSRAAFDDLFDLLRNKESIQLTIINEGH